MRTRVKGLVKLLSSMALMIIITVALSCASSTELNKSSVATALNATVEKMDGIEKDKNVLEIIACIGEMKSDCEMSIGIINNTDPAIQTDLDISYAQVIEKAVTIQFLQGWPPGRSKVEKPCVGKDDLVSFKKYKAKEPTYEVSHDVDLFRKQRPITLDQKIGECDFTYDELFKVALSLVQQDKAQLGKETVLVKSRDFGRLPEDTFFKGPIKRKPY